MWCPLLTFFLRGKLKPKPLFNSDFLLYFVYCILYILNSHRFWPNLHRPPDSTDQRTPAKWPSAPKTSPSGLDFSILSNDEGLSIDIWTCPTLRSSRNESSRTFFFGGVVIVFPFCNAQIHMHSKLINLFNLKKYMGGRLIVFVSATQTL